MHRERDLEQLKHNTLEAIEHNMRPHSPPAPNLFPFATLSNAFSCPSRYMHQHFHLRRRKDAFVSFTSAFTSTMIAVAASPSFRVASVPRVRSRHASRSCRAVRHVTRASAEDEDKPPPGCSRYEVRIKKPLGLVLEEDKSGKIFVMEVIGTSSPHSGLTSTR